MKIAYKISETEAGQATDLRFVKDNYITEQGEVIIEGDVLPEIETLHTQAYVAAKALSDIRAKRKALLAECDWTQVLDTVLTPAKQEEWAIYRQALRDFPSTVDIADTVWPEKPA